MNLEFFPHFIRANYKSLADETNEQLIEFGKEFKSYLEKKFSGKMDRLKPIWDIEKRTIHGKRLSSCTDSPLAGIHKKNY
jgi:hypothetical protein